MTETYRLFIAIELPSSAKMALGTVQGKLKSATAVRWINPNSIHLTLQFLGETPVTQVEVISEALRKTVPALAPFTLSLAGVGVFPNLKHPRIVWAGISDGADEVKTLNKAVIDVTRTIGFQPESRPFAPHLTIGRTQKWARNNDYAQIASEVKDCRVAHIDRFPVNRVGLIRSQLTPKGPIYTSLATIRLGGLKS